MSFPRKLAQLIEPLEQQKQEEAVSAQEFARLKSVYLAETYKDTSPTSPLYSILLQMDSGAPLTNQHIEWLKANKLYSSLAIYWQDSFRQSKEPWDLVKASRYWRDAGQPKKVITLTDYLLNKCQLDTAQLRAAVFTTRGGAFRDMDDLDRACEYAWEAINSDPNSFYAHNLLGAIYFGLSDPVTGVQHFEAAVQLGALPRVQVAQMRSALDSIGEQQRIETARYLLQKDPELYKWASYYLR